MLAAFFLTNAILAEVRRRENLLSQATLGAQPFPWSLLGIEGTLNFTIGVLLWPFIFILTDTINEYFGVVWCALHFVGGGGVHRVRLRRRLCLHRRRARGFRCRLNAQLGVPDVQKAYALIFGQDCGPWRILKRQVPILGKARRRGDLASASAAPPVRRVGVWLRATGLYGAL